jgi:small redox-active disulfide protein 2
MEIKVLGTGCAKCKKLFAEAEEGVRRYGQPVTVVKVEDVKAIMAYGVRQTPALVIDGRVRSTGRIASAEEISGWLAEPVGKRNG